MPRTWVLGAAAVLSVAIGLGAGFAQTTSPPGTLYVLGKGSTFSFGCFPPCLCPVFETDAIHGVFRLTKLPNTNGSPFTDYAVTDVLWWVKKLGEVVPVTGSGTYEQGGEFAVEQRLALDLQVGGDAVQHFDSGLVPGGGEFPVIDATISLHGGVCFDTEFHVRATPVGGCL